MDALYDIWSVSIMQARKLQVRDFLGAAVVRTPSLHCRGHRFNSPVGNWDPTCYTAQSKKKKSCRWKRRGTGKWRFRGRTGLGSVLEKCWSWERNAWEPTHVSLPCIQKQSTYTYMCMVDQTSLAECWFLEAERWTREHHCTPLQNFFIKDFFIEVQIFFNWSTVDLVLPRWRYW